MPKPKRIGRKLVNKKGRKKGNVSRHGKNVSYTSLNEIEDRNDMSFWNRVTRDAGINAINENIALDIPVTLLENGWIVKKFRNGTVEKIKRIEMTTSTALSYKLRKGSILHIKSVK